MPNQCERLPLSESRSFRETGSLFALEELRAELKVPEIMTLLIPSLLNPNDS
jgi:hypothetical protein